MNEKSMEDVNKFVEEDPDRTCPKELLKHLLSRARKSIENPQTMDSYASSSRKP